MKDKRRFRVIEVGKSLLIPLLVLSLLYLVGRTQFSDKVENSVKSLLSGGPEESAGAALDQTSSVKINPLRLAVYHDGLRYGVQYDQETVDADYSNLSILFAEALSSAAVPEEVSERVWQKALCRTGIYMDFYYPVPLNILAGWLGDDSGALSLTGVARQICLAADGDGGVSLYYIDGESGTYYACATTLSQNVHLDTAVEDWSPNGAQFAFEVEGMEALEPYTLLTATPEPAVYAVSNPLLDDASRVESLLSELSFHSLSFALSPVTGGQVVEGNDSLRLTENGMVTFHTFGDSDFRFPVSGDSIEAALEYVQTLAEATVGTWCGQAKLCLAEINETAERTEFVFQYCLNGVPVKLPEGYAAARFVVSNGAIKDFSLYLRCYTDTGETSLVLPVVQAAAAMKSMKADGKELILLYEDLGAEQLSAGWVAN